MKKLFAAILTLTLFLSAGSVAFADSGRFSHFLAYRDWTDGQFTDVKSTDWFYDSVVATYKMGLLNGRQENAFVPGDNVTIGEAVALAASIRSLYNTASLDFAESEPWYRSYVSYALINRIITEEYPDYNADATRAQFAEIMARALPFSSIERINSIPNNSIPDVPYSSPYAGAVYTLYRAGILTGCDRNGTFCPDNTITRAEAAVITGRMVMESQRKAIALSSPERAVLSGEDIFAKCSKAVFFVQMFDADGRLTSTGSGFFINSDGTAVTCVHVLKRGVKGRITIADTGEHYDIKGVYDYSTDDDWAVIQVDGSGFSYLDIGDGSTNVGGASVYAFGSPLGLQNTITQGLVCNPTRIDEGTEFILFSAAISSGSSGGALINKYGEVIGITAATYIFGQNLNLAIKATYLDGALRHGLISLEELSVIAAAAPKSDMEASSNDAA